MSTTSATGKPRVRSHDIVAASISASGVTLRYTPRPRNTAASDCPLVTRSTLGDFGTGRCRPGLIESRSWSNPRRTPITSAAWRIASKGAGHVGVSGQTRIVADCQAFAWPTEHDLGADHKAGQPDRVDLGTPDGSTRASTGPWRSASPTVVSGSWTFANVSASSRAVPLGTSDLALAGVIDDLPVREDVLRRIAAARRSTAAMMEKVARSDHSDGSVASQPVWVRVVTGGQPAAPNDHVDLGVDGGPVRSPSPRWRW